MLRRGRATPSMMNLEMYSVPDSKGLVHDLDSVGHHTEHGHIHKVVPMRVQHRGKSRKVIACPVCLIDIDGRQW